MCECTKTKSKVNTFSLVLVLVRVKLLVLVLVLVVREDSFRFSLPKVKCLTKSTFSFRFDIPKQHYILPVVSTWLKEMTVLYELLYDILLNFMIF